MFNQNTIIEFKNFWRNGLNQSALPAGSSKRVPAFNYHAVNDIHTDYPDSLPTLTFQPENWNDIMMNPLRSLLDYVQFGQTAVNPDEMEKYLNDNFHFLDTQALGNIASTILVSNDKTMSIQWHYDDDQNTYIIRIPNSSPIMVNIYKSRGRIESITGLALDSEPIELEDIDAVYQAFNIRKISYL